jgi:hypothetical protein
MLIISTTNKLRRSISCTHDIYNDRAAVDFIILFLSLLRDYFAALNLYIERQEIS